MYIYIALLFNNVFQYFLFALCSKKDPHMLTRAVPLLHLLMYDGNVNIQKRVIVCFMQLYRLTLTVSVCTIPYDTVLGSGGLVGVQDKGCGKSNGGHVGGEILVLCCFNLISLLVVVCIDRLYLKPRLRLPTY